MFGSESVGLRAGESTGQSSKVSSKGSWEGPGWVLEIPDAWEGDDRRCLLLADVESLVPGRDLAEVVWGVDRSRLSGYDLVRLLQAEARLVAHFQGAYYSTITEISGLLTDADTASAEVAAALHLTRAGSEAEYGLAGLLARYPAVLEGLGRGDIDLRRARVICDGIASLDQETADKVMGKVLPVAGGLTTGQLRARVNRLRMEHDAESARIQYQTALEERRIVVSANPDGTANLSALNLAPETVMASAAASTTTPDWPEPQETTGPQTRSEPTLSVTSSPEPTTPPTRPLKPPSTSPSPSPPSSNYPKHQETSPDTGQSSPNSPVRSPPTRPTAAGNTSSPTKANPSPPEPSAAGPPPG